MPDSKNMVQPDNPSYLEIKRGLVLRDGPGIEIVKNIGDIVDSTLRANSSVHFSTEGFHNYIQQGVIKYPKRRPIEGEIIVPEWELYFDTTREGDPLRFIGLFSGLEKNEQMGVSMFSKGEPVEKFIEELTAGELFGYHGDDIERDKKIKRTPGLAKGFFISSPYDLLPPMIEPHSEIQDGVTVLSQPRKDGGEKPKNPDITPYDIQCIFEKAQDALSDLEQLSSEQIPFLGTLKDCIEAFAKYTIHILESR